MEASALHERLRLVVGTRSYRTIGELTGTNAETVRRYVLGQAPSVDFLASLCDAFQINAEWLLSGRGPMRVQEIRSHALQQASPGELLTAMASTIERLTERVERLEIFVQTLETRLHAAIIPPTFPSASTNHVQQTVQDEQGSQARPEAVNHDPDAAGRSNHLSSPVEIRIQRISDAAAQRPPAADG